jgi:hypothetical protein
VSGFLGHNRRPAVPAVQDLNNDALANSNWKNAMNLEYDALMKNKT